jgi:NTE family protein
MSASPVTAFVFAGGGSLGAVQVGMLHALVANGLQPDFVVGSSAGAINAAYFAGAPDAAGVARLGQLWRSVRRKDIMPLSLRGMLAMLVHRQASLIGADGMRRLLERHLDYGEIERSLLRLHIVATDHQLGNEVVLSAGPLIEAVMASAAIPGIFPPVRIAGRDLVDGGVANNTPVSVAVGLGAARIIVLPAGFACALRRPPVGAIAQVMHALSLLVARQLLRDLAYYASAADIIVVPPLCPLDVSPYDYTACASLIERAAVSTGHWLEEGGMQQRSVPMQLHEHHH